MKNFFLRLLQAVGLCVWAIVAVIAAQFIVSFPMSWILGSKIVEPVWTAVYSALTYLLALFITVFVPKLLDNEIHRYSRKNQPVFSHETLSTTREELGLKGLPTFTDIGLAPVFFIAYIFAAWLASVVMSQFSWFDANQAQDVGFNMLNSGVDRIVAFLALVVCAPVAEEIIFRGWLYGKTRSRLNVILSIILVSAVFGFMHGQWNVAVNVGIMSLFCCIQREITGTIYSGILLHMIKNGVAFYLLYVVGTF